MKAGENPKMPHPQGGRSIKTYTRGTNDAPSITKYGSPIRLDAQIVALCPHCAPENTKGAGLDCRELILCNQTLFDIFFFYLVSKQSPVFGKPQNIPTPLSPPKPIHNMHLSDAKSAAMVG